MLFFRLRGLLVAHVERVLTVREYHWRPLYSRVNNGAFLKELRKVEGDEEFLTTYCTSFRDFYTGAGYSSELFRYLNRYWVTYSHCETGQAPVPGVYQVDEVSLSVSTRFDGKTMTN
jgi:hypothetical protein